MKVNRELAKIVLSLCVFATGSSAFAQKLYPVQGPLATQMPQPVFIGKIKHKVFGSGPSIKVLTSWTVANGEVLEGSPKKVKADSVNFPTAENSAPPQPNLAFAWDAVYGQGFYVAHLLGKDIWQGVFTDKQGTVLQIESVDGENGVGVDNKGNTYKLVWR